MNKVQAKIDRLFDSRFVTDLVGLQSDEGFIEAIATCFYLDPGDLETFRPLLSAANNHADVGQVGCYHAKPICLKSRWEPNGSPSAEYQGVLFTYWVYREILPISSFREWLVGRWEDASKKKLGFEALDRYEQFAQRSAISKKQLEPIVEAARARYFASWEIGVELLRRLAAQHSLVRDVLTDLMATGNPTDKLRVLGTLSDHLPKSFCIGLIRKGLKDRSKHVRLAAAGLAQCLILSELLDDLMHTADVEKDREAKFQIEVATALIKDGFHLHIRKDGIESLAVRISDGWPATLTYPHRQMWSKAAVEEKGLRAVVEEIRRQFASATKRPFNWPVE